MSKSSENRPFEEFDLGDGRDEANLAEFPLGLLSEQGVVEGKSVVFRDEQGGTLTMTAGRYGLPTPVDDDVLLALLTLSKHRDNFQSQRVQFTGRDLIRLLDWPDAGTSYERLEQSISCLVSLNLEYKGCWWDNGQKTRSNLSFHVIESAWTYDPQQPDAERKPEKPDKSRTVCWIRWNEEFLKGCRNGNVRRLNLNVYLSLSSPIAKKLYRLLAKLLRKRDAWTFDLMTLAIDRLKLSESYRKDAGKLKTKLRRGIQELEAIGFLATMTEDERYQKLKPGKWTIRFVKGPNFQVAIEGLAEANLDVQPKAPTTSESSSRSAPPTREMVIETTAVKIETSLGDPASAQSSQLILSAQSSETKPKSAPAAASKQRISPPSPPETSLEPPSGLVETISLLVNRGVAPKRAEALAAKYGDENVRERIAIFDWIRKTNANGTGKNPAGWLAASIEKGFEVPEEYLKAQRRKQQRAQEDQDQIRRRLEREKEEADRQENIRLGEMIDAMSPREREELKREALGEMDAATRAVYEKLTPESVREQSLRTPMRDILRRRQSRPRKSARS